MIKDAIEDAASLERTESSIDLYLDGWRCLEERKGGAVTKVEYMLTQEMLNEIMVRPGEQRGGPKHKPMRCPACHEAYLGNGIVMCIDCEIERRLPNAKFRET